MATPKKISQLDVATTVDDADVLPVVEISTDITKQITFANLKHRVITVSTTAPTSPAVNDLWFDIS